MTAGADPIHALREHYAALEETAALDRAALSLLIGGSDGGLMGEILAEAPWLLTALGLAQVSALGEFVCGASGLGGPEVLLLPGSCGLPMDHFGWDVPPATAAVALPGGALLLHDTVPPRWLAPALDSLERWAAAYSHAHEDHTPRNLPGALITQRSRNLAWVLGSPHSVAVLSAERHLLETAVGRRFEEVVVEARPGSGHSLELGSARVGAVAALPHTPPEPTVLYLLDAGEMCVLFGGDGFELDALSDVWLGLSSLLDDSACSRAAVVTTGGILRIDHRYATAMQPAALAWALEELGVRVEAVGITHVPAEQYLAASVVAGAGGEAARRGLEALSSLGGVDPGADPIYAAVEAAVSAALRDVTGRAVPVVTADRSRLLSDGRPLSGVMSPADLVWLASSLERRSRLELVRSLATSLSARLPRSPRDGPRIP